MDPEGSTPRVLPLSSITLAGRRLGPAGASRVGGTSRAVAVAKSRPARRAPEPRQETSAPAPAAAVTAAAAPARPGPRARRAGVRAALLLAPLGAGGRLFGLARSAAARLIGGGGGGAGEGAGRACLSDARIFPSLAPRAAGAAPGARPGAPCARGPALVWFRGDLRLSDHEALVAANGSATSLVPVYCFDPRDYGQAPGAFSRTGPYRAAFVLGAVAALRAELRDRGSELVVRVGRPEEVLPQLAAKVGAGRVYCHAEVGPEERAVEAAVARGLDEQGAALQVLWGGTLFHPDDLPFKPAAAPEWYGDFRDRVSGAAGGGGAGRGPAGRRGRGAPVRRPLAAPESLKGMPAGSAIAPGDLPTLAQLGLRRAALQRARADTAAAGARLRGGGERDALAHVQAFARQVQQRGAAGRPSPAFAGRVAPWLDVGCLSPRSLYHALQGQLAPHGDGAQRGGGLSWLLFELMWRDFHRFLRFKAAATQGQHGQRQAPMDATPGSLPAMAMA